jgi:hypothetical protein
VFDVGIDWIGVILGSLTAWAWRGHFSRQAAQ